MHPVHPRRWAARLLSSWPACGLALMVSACGGGDNGGAGGAGMPPVAARQAAAAPAAVAPPSAGAGTAGPPSAGGDTSAAAATAEALLQADPLPPTKAADVARATTLAAAVSAAPGVPPASFSNFESPQVHPLDLTPDQSLLLVANTANGTLEIHDAAGPAPALRHTVKVGMDPVSVRARSNTEAWVVNRVSRSVSVVDLAAGRVVDVLPTDDEPADVVFAGAPARAYVSCSAARTLLVFDPADRRAAPARVPILGEQPRALAASRDGRQVYLAIFESGNGTTALTGGKSNGFEADIARDPRGPYGGASPPPNSDNATRFNPPLNPANPAPPPVSVIVRKDGQGGWRDDNGRDWRRFVSGDLSAIGGRGGRVAGWDLVDRDVAVVDTRTLAVSYRGGLANIVMALAVNPASGAVTAVGTDATNQVRFEPVLQSLFLRVQAASFDPAGTAPAAVADLNPHLDYRARRIPAAQRALSLGDPRGLAWNAAGTRGWVTGMGSNSVVAIQPDGRRVPGLAPIAVGEGPTGIVLQEGRGRAFVLNRFGGTLSVLDLAGHAETARVPLAYDPTPAVIRAGRPLLYDTHLASGLGQVACASCHVDARTDRLAWDLGNPAGPVLRVGGADHPPMKGPLLTMTLIDAVQAQFLHWRGDRASLHDFADSAQTLQGADGPLSAAQIQQLHDYLATTRTPPNPYRNLDNGYPTLVQVPGMRGEVGRVGNAVAGRAQFEGSCRQCHSGQTARGSSFFENGFGLGQKRNPPRWQNFYRRMGLWFKDATASTAGFGFQQDGTFDSTHNGSRSDDMMAFMMAFNGSFPDRPAGLTAFNTAVDAHAAVGRQVVLDGRDDGGAPLATLLSEADLGRIGLVAWGCVAGERRGYAYLGQRRLQSDRRAETMGLETLRHAGTAASPVVLMAVRAGTQERLGVDENLDGVYDGDAVPPSSRACVAPPGPGNLLVNGGFEINGVAPGGWAQVPALAGWRNTAGPIEVWRNYQGRTGALGSASWMELDARGGSPDRVSQTVRGLVPGRTYTLSYWVSARPGTAAATNAHALSWNGVVIDAVALEGRGLAALDWQQRVLRVVATGQDDTLTFSETGADDGFGTLIDEVVLQ